MEVISSIPVAIEIAVSICEMVGADREKKGSLREVENKIAIVKTVLDMIDPSTAIAQVDTLKLIVQTLKQLSDEVTSVKKMTRFVYIFQAKGCQDRLRHIVDTLQFYLNSLQVAQTSEISKFLRESWSTAVDGDAGLLQQLEEERCQADELRRQVDAKSLEVEQLKQMGLHTKEDLRGSLSQAEDVRRSLEHQMNAKSQQEATYLKQVIYLIQQEEQLLQLIQEPEENIVVHPVTPSQEEDLAVIRLPPIPDCPITGELIRDPVILDCACRPTVDRESFQVWLRHQTSLEVISSNGPPRCPCCSSPLSSMNVHPNVLLRDMIEATARLEKEISNSKIFQESPLKHEGDPVMILTDVERGSSKMNFQENSSKHTDKDCWNHPAITGASDVEGTALHRHWDESIPHGETEESGSEEDMVGDEDEADDQGSSGAENVAKLCTITRRHWPVALPAFVLMAVVIGLAFLPKNDPVRKYREPSSYSFVDDCCSQYTQNQLAHRISLDPLVPLPTRGNCRMTLEGSMAGEEFGRTVAFSSNGTRVAIGSKYNDNQSGEHAGLVQVFDLVGSTFTKVGDGLIGTEEDDRFGRGLAISADGTRLAIGAYGNNNENSTDAGHVQVYEWIGSRWSQVGDDLKGTGVHDWFGRAVAFSADWNRLAVGAPSWKSDIPIGFVQVFEWTGLEWSQVGKDLDGLTAADEFGSTLAFSSDGMRLAVAAPSWNDIDKGKMAGLVQVFEWNGSGPSSETT